jgi:twitching motility protein PilT
MNIVMRKIETKIPEFHAMGFPPVVESKLSTLNGLILVTGPTGSGKSTSLAAMIDHVNTNKDVNIITVEDPIEFVHEPKNSIITQRELGANTPTFTDALRESLREDPDVILVGELRDQETISLALTAAETGHLVFGTLHTSGAPNTIHRIIDAFPPGQQDQIRAQIATSLKLVITQRLMKRADGNGRVAAFEILVSNNAVQNLIRENKIFQLPSTMQTGVSDGMVQMEKSIEELLNSGVINHDGIGH